MAPPHASNSTPPAWWDRAGSAPRASTRERTRSRTDDEMARSKKSDRASAACRGRTPAGDFVVSRHCETDLPPHPASERAASRYAIVLAVLVVGAAPTSATNPSRIRVMADGAPVQAPPTETPAPLEGIQRTRQLDHRSGGAEGAHDCQASRTSGAF